MGLFKNAGTANNKRSVGSVTLFTVLNTGAFGGFISGIGGAISSDVIIEHMEAIKASYPAFASAVIEYMRDYEITIQSVDSLPDANDSAAIAQYLRKRFSNQTDQIMMATRMMTMMYVIEYGEPDPDRKLSERMAKDVRNSIYAKNQLEDKYEKYAREIVRIYKEKPSLEDSEPELRAIGQEINNFDQMSLIAKRARVLCAKDGIKGFSIRILEYAWDGIAGYSR
mgnify:CR=1 FL=1